MKHILLLASIMLSSAVFAMENEETRIKNTAEKCNIKTHAKTIKTALFDSNQNLLRLQSVKSWPHFLGSACVIAAGTAINLYSLYPLYISLMSGALSYSMAKESNDPSRGGAVGLAGLISGISGTIGLGGLLLGSGSMFLGARHFYRYLPKNIAKQIKAYESFQSALK